MATHGIKKYAGEALDDSFTVDQAKEVWMFEGQV